MFLLLTAVPALIAAWALGGRLLSVFEYRWKGFWLIWVALGVQIVLFTPIGNGISDGMLRVTHLLTYLPIIGFLWANRAAGLGLVAAGVVSNLLAISVNGGLMPADAGAQQVFYEDHGTFTHALNTDNTSPHLLFLGDVMALPGWFPFTNAFSIGDVLLAMGLVWVVVRLSLRVTHPAPIMAIVPPLPAESLRTALPAAFAMLAAGWIALAAAVGAAIGDSRAWLLLVAVGASTGPWALAMLNGSAAQVLRRPFAMGCAVVTILGAAVATSMAATAGVALGALGAGLLMRAACPGDRPPGPRAGEPLRDLLGPACAALGLASGAVLVAHAGLMATLAVSGALGTLSASVRPRLASVPAGVESPNPQPLVATVSSSIAFPAVVSLLAGLGVVTIAAPVWASSALDMGVGAFGLLAAALVAGALCGILMTGTLAPERTPPALGVSLVFCALSVGLLATSTLAMTAVAGSVVLGISSGAAAWMLRPQLGRAHPAVPGSVFVAGAIGGVLLATLDAPRALWIVGAHLGAMGLVAVAVGLSNRLAPREVGAG